VIYEKKGFDGELLNQIIEKITVDDQFWVAEMLTGEIELQK
jgi:hypothetical protein